MSDYLTFFINQELFEIPPHISAVIRVGSQIFIQRGLFFTFDINFAHHWKSDSIVFFAETEDFSMSARLLCSEIITRKTDYRESIILELTVQFLESVILGSVAALACYIYHEDNLSFVIFQINILVLDALHFETQGILFIVMVGTHMIDGKQSQDTQGQEAFACDSVHLIHNFHRFVVKFLVQR